MPMNRQNQRFFHRHLYGGNGLNGWLDTITLVKRANDQNQGQQRTLTLFDCREKKIEHQGEPLRGTAAAGDRTVWQIPRIELDRVGVTEINTLDWFIGPDAQKWQPEADTLIHIQLGKNFINVYCKRMPGTGS